MEFHDPRNPPWPDAAAGLALPPGIAAAVLGAMAVLLLFALWQRRRAARARAREQRLRRLIDQSLHLIAVVDADGRVLRLNRTGQQWLQLDTGQVRGRPLHDVAGLPADDLHGVALGFALEGARQGQPVNHEIVAHRRDGSRLHLDCTLRLIPPEPGESPEVLLEARDVTLRKVTEAKLRLAADVFDQAREGILISDDQGQVVSVNHALCEISGQSADDMMGQPLETLPVALGDADHRPRVLEALDRDGHWQGELRQRRVDGREVVCWLSVTRRHDESGRPTHTIAILNDITQFREAERNLARIAHLDGLTGLPNRALFADRVGQLTSAARRDQRPFALMYLDLDQFKNVNEGLGHRVGDGLLATIGGVLQGTLRECDTVARLGGDEFGILLPATDADGAAQVAQKLLDRVSQPVTVSGHELAVTVSIGIAVFPSDGEDYEVLSRHADTAMFRAKHEGRALARFFAEGMQRSSARHLQLDAALRKAVERDELLVHYQPQLSADGRTLVGTEALLRWRHPEFGLVSPAEFIPIAEDNGQIVQIGEWVMRTAARQARAWMDAGLPPMVVAVNVSVVQFRHPSLVDVVRRALADADLPARWLELELTESVFSDDLEATTRTMEQLRDLGVRLSIDDFGTGYCSLAYLKKFPISVLKIDQQFVRDIETDPDDRALVLAIIQMARALKLQTVAEGVETEGQHRFLRREGCDLVQGYRFCRPVEPAALAAWAREFHAAQARADAEASAAAGTVAAGL